MSRQDRTSLSRPDLNVFSPAGPSRARNFSNASAMSFHSAKSYHSATSNVSDTGDNLLRAPDGTASPRPSLSRPQSRASRTASVTSTGTMVFKKGRPGKKDSDAEDGFSSDDHDELEHEDHNVDDDEIEFGSRDGRDSLELGYEEDEVPTSGTSDSFSLNFSEMEHEDEMSEDVDADSDEPLVRRRRRRRSQDETGYRSLFELVAPLILAHPLALFPALSAVPQSFLPAGVALFIPVFCILSVLSACAHIVIVYLAWYLKVGSFEQVFAACAGERFGRFGQAVGRGFVCVATMGTAVGWLGIVASLLDPVAQEYLPAGLLRSRIFWTITSSIFILPAIIPSRTIRPLRVLPVAFAFLLPLVTFIVIGRTVEVKKAADEAGETIVTAAATAAAAAQALREAASAGVPGAAEGLRDHLRRGLGGLSPKTAVSGLTTLTMFFTPHLQTLPIHSSLKRAKRQQFAVPILASGLLILVLSLPFALVPYYLLPAGPTAFDQLPRDDAWTNFARVLMCFLVLASVSSWLVRGRDSILVALGADGGDRYRAGKFVGAGIWVVVVAFAALGGVVANKIELLGVIATLAIGWFLPSLFFIITFHVRSPLAIIFPSHAPPPPTPVPEPSPLPGMHQRTPSLTNPAADVLLARKERQLQKRRQGRRLWQDLIVYVGILPVGIVTLFWSVGSLIGLW